MDLEPCILTPRTAKRANRDFLRKVRDREEEAIQMADQVFVLGWSIPKTDQDQETLIRCSVAKRGKPIESLVAVNYRAGAPYYFRVAEIFDLKSDAVQVYDSGFIDFSSQLSTD